MPDVAPAKALTENQANAVRTASASHEALEKVQRVLQAALGRPQPLRETHWAARVESALSDAGEALGRHKDEVLGPGGLYDELRLEAPWLIPRVAQLDAQFARVESEAGDIAAEVSRVRAGDLQGMPAIRHDAERMLASLRDLLAKEADLMFERFNEPSAAD